MGLYSPARFLWVICEYVCEVNGGGNEFDCQQGVFVSGASVVENCACGLIDAPGGSSQSFVAAAGQRPSDIGVKQPDRVSLARRFAIFADSLGGINYCLGE